MKKETYERTSLEITEFENEDEAKRFNYDEFADLPSNVVWGIDKQGEIGSLYLRRHVRRA